LISAEQTGHPAFLPPKKTTPVVGENEDLDPAPKEFGVQVQLEAYQTRPSTGSAATNAWLGGKVGGEGAGAGVGGGGDILNISDTVPCSVLFCARMLQLPLLFDPSIADFKSTCVCTNSMPLGTSLLTAVTVNSGQTLKAPWSPTKKVDAPDVNVRGTCAECGKDVLDTEVRSMAQDGTYRHEPCAPGAAAEYKRNLALIKSEASNEHSSSLPTPAFAMSARTPKQRIP
jgi:hypothetical protein